MRRVFVTALAAGLVAGLAFFAVQAWQVLPVIRAAETHEAATPPQHGAADHHHYEAAWEPAEGFERIAFTAVADVVTGIGFAMLLVGAFTLHGTPMNVRRGLLWGAGGYLVFALAPALVLPPEPPGAVLAELGLRQAWWLGTAAATAAGLAMIAFVRAPWAKLGGLALVLLPHVFRGAHPVGEGGTVPPDLASEFIAASLIATAVFWIVLGGASGWLYPRAR